MRDMVRCAHTATTLSLSRASAFLVKLPPRFFFLPSLCTSCHTFSCTLPNTFCLCLFNTSSLYLFLILFSAVFITSPPPPPLALRQSAHTLLSHRRADCRPLLPNISFRGDVDAVRALLHGDQRLHDESNATGYCFCRSYGGGPLTGVQFRAQTHTMPSTDKYEFERALQFI